MGLRENIQHCLRERPNLSGEQIAAHLGVKANQTFWRILNEEQVRLRGVYPARRHNTTAHTKVRAKGTVRFIPPESGRS